MILKAFHDLVEVEGDPMSLALYTVGVLELLKKQGEIDQAERDQEFLKKFGDISLADLMRMEQGESGSTDEDDTNGG